MSGLKVKDVAIRLNVSEKTIYKWLQDGLIPATRIGKTWLISEQAIEALFKPVQSESVSSRGILKSRGYVSDFRSNLGEIERPNVNINYSMEEALKAMTQLVSGATEQGISGVLGPRRIDPDTVRHIGSSLELAEGEILLQGIGLREFFGDQYYTPILHKMISEDRPVFVRALLVNPMGEFARARTVAEDGEHLIEDTSFRASPLFGDSWRSLNVITSMKKAAEKLSFFNLDVKFIDQWPAFYMIHSKQSAFLETYHFGRPELSIEGSTLDGLVPMLEINPDSSYHQLLRNHFDYLWLGNNPFIKVQSVEEIVEIVRIQI